MLEGNTGDLRRYNFMKTKNFQLGLTGFPLEHSLSPKIHTAALQACQLDGEYSLFPVHPHDRQALRDLLDRVRSRDLHGLNVTIPHKQTVIPYLDELTPTARSIGAVNTIYLSDDRLVGDNTDAPGFLADLKKFLDAESLSHSEVRTLVLGAGGSARAVVYALLHHGWSVTIAARRLEQAEQIAGSFTAYQLKITDVSLSDLDASKFTLVVNTTPIGMTPNTHQSPWPAEVPFPPRAAIYDLVYNPRETKLVQEACARGLSATTGVGMLIEQAALAFEIWTGCEPPREALLRAVNQT